MDDSFELEYADELEALEELQYDDAPAVIVPKSKRSIVFGNGPQEVSQSGAKSQTSENSNSQFQSSLNFSLSDDEPGDNFKRKRLLESAEYDDEDEPDGTFEVLNSISSQKRVKLTQEEETEGRLLRQILEQRASTNRAVVNQQVDDYRLNDNDDVERKRVSKRIPQCDFVSVRSYDGLSVYMKLWNEDVLESEYDCIGSNSRSTSLLTVPVSIMRDQMEELEESERMENMGRFDDVQCMEGGKDNREASDSSTMDVVNDTRSEDIEDVTDNMKSLWVEKYAPQKYTELLSEEAVNRSLLHWIRLWDFVVFNKEVPKMKKTDKLKENNKFNKFKKKTEPDILESLDKHHRPQQKVALLCGPPGLGKTTLAHIVARHAGYNVVEMNASDDRSVEVFRTKLESATQMKAVLGGDHSPNCLVIDEIDGAPAPAINVLLNMIKKAELEETSTKKKREGGLLRRPIICICNDQYVPALRQLRQGALLLNFPQTEASRLASRLYEVVQVEELKADINTLLALCERTDNDIRSCLNTLQFVRQKKKELSLQTVRTMSVGQKDSQKSLFAVWRDVFAMPREKKNRFISIHDLTEGKQGSMQGTNITPQSRFEHILHMVQSAGEYDRIMQGLFENYLSAKSKDPYLLGLNQATDWLVYVDGLNQYIGKNQDYSVAKYTSYLPIVFHFLYASFAPQRLQFPQSQNEAKQKTMKTKNLLSTMMADMTPLVRKFINPDMMVMDLLSPLLDVLQPTLRPVNTLLYSSKEKEELANVVRIMIAYNMTYRQEKSLEGQYNYVLDPNVEEIVQFPELKQRRQLTYAAKQMIAREIELEKMRRNEGYIPESKTATTTSKPTTTTPNSSSAAESSKDRTTNSDKDKEGSVVPNHLKKLEAKKISDDGPAVNFFGNFKRTRRERSTKESDSTTGSVQEVQKDIRDKRKLLETVIWFHFKEGYSNAVRRTIKVEDFL